jgi:enediyne biosynthesis protein E3
MWKQLKLGLLSMPKRVRDFDRHGFASTTARARPRLEAALHAFATGHDLALRYAPDEMLLEHLTSSVMPDWVGIACEGVGMHLGFLDLVLAGKQSRVLSAANGALRQHRYLVAVGAGFAFGRVPFALRKLSGYLETLDPDLAWCVIDGLGFHEGLFQRRRYVERRESPPAFLNEAGVGAFMSGIGRSLWWIEGANPAGIAERIQLYDGAHHQDLWAGIGTACSYAGGVDDAELKALAQLSGEHLAAFLSGPPFAAAMRVEGTNPSEVTERGCQVLLGLSAEEAAGRALATIRMALLGLSAERIREEGYLILTTHLRDAVIAGEFGRVFEVQIGTERNLARAQAVLATL